MSSKETNNFKKSKGFTLIELLAVILIIGIISLVAIPAIDRVVRQSREELYSAQLSTIESAAKDWAASNVDLLPENEGEKITLTLGQLKVGKFVKDDIKDPRNKQQFPNDMEILIIRGVNSLNYEIVEDSGGVNNIINYDSPIVVLNGEAHEIVEINEEYIEKGASAREPNGSLLYDVETEIRSNNNIVNKVDTSFLLQYKITYTAEYNGVKSSVIRTVTVRDTKPPTLTIPLNTTLSVDEVANFNYMDGVQVSDNSREVINVKVSGNISALPGVYLITYTAADSSGNKTQKNRSITVVNPSYPTIELKGSNPTVINLGETYRDAGVIALDKNDGDLTNIVSISSNVNINRVGSYTVWYKVANSLNKITEVSRKVVVSDNIPPNVSFSPNGSSSIAPIHETQITVSDEHSAIDLNSLKYLWSSSTATPKESNFNITFTNGQTVSTPKGGTGSYYLWVMAKDVEGNTAIERSNAFNVTDEGIQISFSPNGDINFKKSHSTKVNVNSPYGSINNIYYQWTKSTNPPNSNSFNKTISNNATISTPDKETGNYYLWIKAVDTAGNEKIIGSNAFSIDNEGPRITINPNGSCIKPPGTMPPICNYTSRYLINVDITDNSTIEFARYRWKSFKLNEPPVGGSNDWIDLTTNSIVSVKMEKGYIYFLTIEAQDILGNKTTYTSGEFSYQEDDKGVEY